jgi:hypothetical protein
MGTNQSRDQSWKIVTFDKSSEISGGILDLQLSGCIERDGIYKRIEFRPRDLHLPAEDIRTDRPNPFELLDEPVLVPRIAAGFLAQTAQVAIISIEQKVCGFSTCVRSSHVLAAILRADVHPRRVSAIDAAMATRALIRAENNIVAQSHRNKTEGVLRTMFIASSSQ